MWANERINERMNNMHFGSFVDLFVADMSSGKYMRNKKIYSRSFHPILLHRLSRASPRCHT